MLGVATVPVSVVPVPPSSPATDQAKACLYACPLYTFPLTE